MAKNLAEQLTVFACVKVREGGKASCGGCGARNVLDRLREQIAIDVAAGRLAPQQLEVRPTGCLKKCKKGPALAVMPPRKKAPKKAWKKATLKFKRVNPADVEIIINKIRRRLIHP